MDNEPIQRCILDFCEAGIPEYIARDVRPALMKNMVTTIVGGRKTGKTYLTYQTSTTCSARETSPRLSVSAISISTTRDSTRDAGRRPATH
jgi:hypothetical protein